MGAVYASAGGSHQLTRTTVDGGGTALSGGDYTLNGTTGQPDTAVLTGSTYTLSSGFWGPADACAAYPDTNDCNGNGVPDACNDSAADHCNCPSFIVYDDFNNGMTDPPWTVTMDSCVTWAASETGTVFEVTDILGTPSGLHGGTLTKSIPPQGDFDFEAWISWGSDGPTGMEDVQRLGVSLFAGDAMVAEAALVDGWGDSTGGFWVTANGSTVGQGSSMAAAADGATIRITRVGGVLEVQAIPDSSPSITHSGTSTADVDSIEITFRRWMLPAGIFGTTSVDRV